MNYERIYAAFIADRRAKEPEKPQYYETHHIVPRCLGGGDEPENLIRLTPEDHLFAHLLLARIHGGKLWSAIFFMSGGRRSSRQLRATYGLARRKWSEAERGKEGLKGSENGNYNDIEYQWINLDTGKRDKGTLHDMWIRYGGNRSVWTSAITPNSGKPSAMGWALDDGFIRRRSVKGKVFTFIHRDGRTFTGTQSEFCKRIGTTAATASRVVKQKSVTACGWRLKGIPDRPHYARKSDGSPVRRNTGKIYFASKGGKIVRGTRLVVSRALGSSPGQFSAACTNIAKGISATYKGWEISWQEPLF